MQGLMIDESNNLIIDKKNLSIVSGVNNCAQDVKTRIGICKGENIFNSDEGIAFDEDILGKMGGIEYIKDLIRNRILDSEEIETIQEFSLKHKNKQLEIETKISTIYGVVTL